MPAGTRPDDESLRVSSRLKIRERGDRFLGKPINAPAGHDRARKRRATVTAAAHATRMEIAGRRPPPVPFGENGRRRSSSDPVLGKRVFTPLVRCVYTANAATAVVIIVHTGRFPFRSSAI